MDSSSVLNISIQRTHNLSGFPDELNYYIIRKYLWSSTFYLNRYGSVLWMVLGLVLNPLALITWTRPRLRRHNTSSNYLAGIAVADFLFWLLYLMQYLKMWWNIHIQDAPVWCELFQALFISIQYFSVPLVLVFSIERYIAVCHPFKRDKICTHKRALINTIVCGLLVMVLGFLQMLTLRFNPDSGKCEPRESVLLNLYWHIFQTGVEILISAVLPVATLIVNILVIVELKNITNKSALLKPTLAPGNISSDNSTTDQRHSPMLLDSAPGADNCNPGYKSSTTAVPAPTVAPVNKEKNSFKSSTVLLLSVSFLLIVTTLPVGLVYALQFLCPNGNETLSLDQMQRDPTWIRFANYQIVKELVDFFAQIHFVINFVIYYITGDNFRTEFHKLVSSSKTKSRKGNSYDGVSTGNSQTPGNSAAGICQRNRVDRTELLRKPLTEKSTQPEHSSVIINNNRVTSTPI